MKKFFSILFLIGFLLIKNSTLLNAQCNSILASDICASAPDICDLNGYCGSTLSSYTGDVPSGITCSYSIENNSYIKFTAMSSTVSLTVTVPSCSSSLTGVQLVILQTSDCATFTTVSNCGAIALGATQVVTASGLNPGQVYYIMIDGNAGAVCDYTITTASGVGTCCPVQANAGPDVEICKGDSTTLTATGGISYLWTPGNLTSQSIRVSPASTTRYTVSVSNGTCAVKDSALVTVNATPTVDAGIANPICLGDTTTLHTIANSNLTYSSPLTFNNPTRYPINNLDTTFSVIPVSGLSGSINSNSIVSVCFDITHPNDADLDIFLICPDGSRLELSTDNGGTSDNYTGTCFTLSATQAITSVQAPFSGNYKPEGASGFNALTGCSTNGNWKLAIYDDATGSVGSIDNFSLTINNPIVDTTINYLWSPATNISGVTIQNPDVYPSTTTMYYLTATNSKGCKSKDSVNVIVNPLPLVNAGNDTAICAGVSFNLNGSGANTYQWSPALTLNDATFQNPLATPNVSSTYTLTGTSVFGCTDVDSVSITVNNFPVINAGTDVSICNSDSVQLNATGATQFNWSPSTGLSNTSIANPMARPTVTTIYTVTSNNQGCIGTDNITVNVDQLNVSNDSTICKGESAQLNAAGGTSYSWLPATGLSSDAISNPIATPLITTTYTVTATLGQCVKSDSITIFVKQPLAIQVSNDTTLCLGNSTNLIATGASSYSWSPTDGLNNPLISNPVASPGYSNVYTVTGIDINGCSSTETVTININALPTVNAGNDVTICQGSSTTLNATGGNSLTWTPVASLSSSTIASPVATPSSTTIYIVTATATNGCTDKDSVIVTVINSPLSVSTTSSNATCFGSNNGTASVTPSGGTGVYNYYWFPGGYSVANVNNLAAGTYTVTTTDATTSCKNVSVVSITQPADFILNISSSNATCGNQNGSATVNVTGTSTYQYYWNSSPSQNTSSAINLSAGQYTVTVTNNSSCTKTGVATVTSIDNLNADFTPSVFSGEAPLNVFFTNNSAGATSYNWSFGDASASALTDPSHIYTTPGTYNVQLIASNATCLDTASVIIVIEGPLQYILPNVFTPNGDNENDIFTLHGTGMKNFNGNIFNRWGKKVFEWNDPNGGWNGEDQPDGVYYYTIEFTNNSGELKSLTGFITLLR